MPECEVCEEEVDELKTCEECGTEACPGCSQDCAECGTVICCECAVPHDAGGNIRYTCTKCDEKEEG